MVIVYFGPAPFYEKITRRDEERKEGRESRQAESIIVIETLSRKKLLIVETPLLLSSILRCNKSSRIYENVKVKTMYEESI